VPHPRFHLAYYQAKETAQDNRQTLVTGLPPYCHAAATARRRDIWPLPWPFALPRTHPCGPTGYGDADAAKADNGTLRPLREPENLPNTSGVATVSAMRVSAH
jgi:hypothetical protein